ncbi:alpha/beta fold hydrolase [Nocardia sp. CDC160]|uniref:alpha/beta fold hydrolase n=1 Tax=Nocardia sp. CDC160 TaxID=3112166 RepID=UPI002DB82EE9|nr:alpha/beta hydrolase [Nocardia sp. CDC160]MEC3916428.1 alpha/beta hydrolase [Nocardia sp. CDC160]
MDVIHHRTIDVNGLDMHVAEAGTGPLVVLLHGFPELWYSWRHQLPALAAAGYHAVAPDVRGHGRTRARTEHPDYGMSAHVADTVGLLDALGASTATLVGHDWGANTLWAAAELHPDRFPALVALSVSRRPRTPLPPTEQLRAWSGGRFNWMLYFQEPGVADAALAADVDRSIRRILYGLSGDAGELGIHLVGGLPADADLLAEIPDPPRPLPWLSDADLAYYAAEYRRTGFTGSLNRYRAADHDWLEHPTLGTRSLPQPTLFLGGELEPAVRFGNPAAMRDQVPRLEDPIVLPGCGHWVQQERPDEVNAALIEFLDAHGK